MDATPSFGQWLKARRRALDLTQDALGERAGCAGETVRKIEAGGVRPSQQLAALLAAELDLSLDDQRACVRWARGAPAPAGLAVAAPRPGQAVPALAARPPALGVSLPAPRPGGNGLEPRVGPAANPYKGLRAFQEADAPDFFGREALSSRLLARLAETSELARFLALVGPSGSGKSSAIRAGLLPAIRAGALPGSARWPIAQIVPGAQPLEEIEAALLRISQNPPDSLLPQLREDQRGLLRAVKRALPEDPTVELLLVIDQFEEVFTLLADDVARTHLLDSLYVAVADPSSRLRVVITLRADFYDRPLQYGQMGELLRARTELALPLPPEDLERAIVGPAARVGARIEPELLARILADAGDEPGALPLLQYALTELFERRAGPQLTLAAYQATGGLRGALGQRAEETYAQAAPPDAALARQLFLRLVTLGEGSEDTRRRVRLVELASLAPDPASLDRVIERFARYRLLTWDRDPATSAPTVEVAHEALLQAWGRLREWLDDARENLRVERRLLAAANEWVAAGQDPSFLATGARLAQFQALATAVFSPRGVALNDVEQRFLAASLGDEERRAAGERERQARELTLARETAESAQRAAEAQRSAANRLRLLVGALAGFLLIAAGMGAWALQQSQAAQQNARTAQTALTGSEATRLAAEATSLLGTDSDRQLIALLSIRSLRSQYSPQGEAAIAAATTLDYPQFTFRSDQVALSQIALSSDGRYALTSDWEGHPKLWDTAHGTALPGSQAWSVVNAVAFAPDDATLLLGEGSDNPPRLWDVRTGAERQRFGYPGLLNVQAVAFTPDGKQVVSAGSETGPLGREPQGKVVFFDPAPGPITGRITRTLMYPDPINTLAFSSDGGRLAVGTNTGAAVLDANSGAVQASFQPYTQTVTGIAFSPDGKQALTVGADHTTALWDAASGRALQQLTGHTGAIRSAVFSPDGRMILTVSQDRTARLWDSATGAEIRRIVYNQEFSAGAFTPDGQAIITGSADGAVERWTVARPQGLRQFPGRRGAFSADSQAALTFDGDLTRLWDVASGQAGPVFTLPGAAQSDSFALSADHHFLARSSPDQIRLWDARSGAETHTYAQPFATTLAIAPDDKYVFAGGAGPWSAGHGGVTVGGGAGVFDATIGGALFGLERPSVVLSVAIAPDGRTLLTGEGDGVVRLWEFATARQIGQLAGRQGGILSLAVSPDGRVVATGSEDRTACLWSLPGGAPLRCLQGHSDRVNLVAFSPDGRRVVTASNDRTARIWDVQTGAELRRFSAWAVGADQAAFSPDGRYVLTSGVNQPVTLWNADYEAAIRELCGRLSRDFTAQERQQFGIADTAPTCPGP
jgi:WD40 repeat protein/transcriptional regulator with XRE-family HTH domain